MTRLPQPGNDTNVWGDILNQYLLVSHAADGSLLPEAIPDGSVSTTKLAPNAITTTVIADDTVSQAKLKTTNSPLSGQVLTANGPNLTWQTSTTGVTDHALLSNIGTNTHAQIDTAITASTNHIADTANPHSVTKAQVGLGNVDDTSDANKPISSATQASLDNKASTASNIGTAGIGVFKQKSGVNLEFKKLNAGSNKVTVTNDVVNDEVDIDVTEANLTLANLGGNLPESRITNLATDLSAKADTANPTFTGLLTANTVKITGGTPGTGKVLTSDATGGATWTTPTTGASALDDLSDVSTAGASDGKVLKYSSGTWQPATDLSSAIDWKNVLDYGATPGSDCYTAIIAARDAAGIGGTIYFPAHAAGQPYYTSQTIEFLRGQTVVGGLAAPDYDWDHLFPNGRCVLQATAGFASSAMIKRTNGATGVTIKNLALVGPNEYGNVNGIDFGPVAGGGGERGWHIENCYFNGFKACLAGHMWVVRVWKCHFTRSFWAIKPSAGDDATSAMNDTRIDNIDAYFTIGDAIILDSASEEAGLSSIINSRLERAGSTPNSPNVNRREDSAGVRLVNAHAVTLMNIQTDANSGPGIVLDGTGASQRVHACWIIGGVIKRDGTGNNTDTTLPGILVKGTDICGASGVVITWGDPNDGGPGRAAPQYGLQLAGDNNQFQWTGAVEVPASGSTNAYVYTGTNNWQCSITDTRRQQTGLAAGPSASAPQTPQPGTTYFDTTLGALRTWSGSAWVVAGAIYTTDSDQLILASQIFSA